MCCWGTTSRRWSTASHFFVNGRRWKTDTSSDRLRGFPSDCAGNCSGEVPRKTPGFRKSEDSTRHYAKYDKCQESAAKERSSSTPQPFTSFCFANGCEALPGCRCCRGHRRDSVDVPSGCQKARSSCCQGFDPQERRCSYKGPVGKARERAISGWRLEILLLGV